MAAARDSSSGAGARPAAADALDFSPARHDALHDPQRAVGLIPRTGFGVLRRAALLIGVTWVPLAGWALWSHRAFAGVAAEPLLQHFGIHVRFLIALPLLLAAEPLAEGVARRIFPYFLSSGLVPETQRARFAEIIQGCRRLLRSRLALAAVVGIAFAGASLATFEPGLETGHSHEIVWAVSPDPAGPQPGFGAWWFMWVSRPLYAVLLVNWVWRLIVTAILLSRIARLELQLVPTHPDGCGGLGFLQNLPTAFAPVIAASSAVLAARWGHDVLYHGVALSSLRLPLAIYVALVLVLFLGPLLAFLPKLAALRRRSLFAYGALVGRHGRLVDQRWIRGEVVQDEGLLGAPELGPVADTLTLYGAVASLRSLPIGRQALLTVAAAALLPMLPVVAIQVPIKDQLLQLLKVLM